MNPANIATSLAALGLVIGLVLLGQRLARYLRLPQRLASPATASTRLELTQILTLDPSHKLLLVRCDNRHVLILTGGSQDLNLGWLEPPA